MDLIYSQDLLTVIDMSGKNADSPIAGVTLGTRAQTRTPLGPGMLPHLDAPFSVCTKLPRWYAIEVESRYETRALTVQEKLLSIRSASFSQWGMRFSCLSAGHVTDTRLNKDGSSFEDDTWSVLTVKNVTYHIETGWDELRRKEFISFAAHVRVVLGQEPHILLRSTECFHGFHGKIQ
jgi:hypothetical protein